MATGVKRVGRAKVAATTDYAEKGGHLVVSLVEFDGGDYDLPVLARTADGETNGSLLVPLSDGPGYAFELDVKSPTAAKQLANALFMLARTMTGEDMTETD